MVEKKIKVRRAVPKDIVNIAKMLRGGWNEQTVEYAPIDDLRGFRWLLAIIEDGFIAVADLNGRIVGAACVSPFIPPWSTSWMLDMEFLYIMPTFRQVGVAQGLIQAVEGFADRVKLPMTFGIKTGEKPLVKDRLMEMAGFTYVGGNYLRPYDGQRQEEDNSTLGNTE
jgi:GNAT superfamily N-acetyltransferase